MNYALAVSEIFTDMTHKLPHLVIFISLLFSLAQIIIFVVKEALYSEKILGDVSSQLFEVDSFKWNCCASNFQEILWVLCTTCIE